MDQLGTDFHTTGSVMSPTELRKYRLKRGECVTCGNRCFQKKLFKLIPITEEGRVLTGQCLLCNPLGNTKSVKPAASRRASREDLMRFSRSQSNLALNAQNNSGTKGETRRGLMRSSSARLPNLSSFPGSRKGHYFVASADPLQQSEHSTCSKQSTSSGNRSINPFALRLGWRRQPAQSQPPQMVNQMQNSIISTDETAETSSKSPGMSSLEDTQKRQVIIDIPSLKSKVPSVQSSSFSLRDSQSSQNSSFSPETRPNNVVSSGRSRVDHGFSTGGNALVKRSLSNSSTRSSSLENTLKKSQSERTPKIGSPSSRDHLGHNSSRDEEQRVGSRSNSPGFTSATEWNPHSEHSISGSEHSPGRGSRHSRRQGEVRRSSSELSAEEEARNSGRQDEVRRSCSNHSVEQERRNSGRQDDLRRSGSNHSVEQERRKSGRQDDLRRSGSDHSVEQETRNSGRQDHLIGSGSNHSVEQETRNSGRQDDLRRSGSNHSVEQETRNSGRQDDLRRSGSNHSTGRGTRNSGRQDDLGRSGSNDGVGRLTRNTGRQDDLRKFSSNSDHGSRSLENAIRPALNFSRFSRSCDNLEPFLEMGPKSPISPLSSPRSIRNQSNNNRDHSNFASPKIEENEHHEEIVIVEDGSDCSDADGESREYRRRSSIGNQSRTEGSLSRRSSEASHSRKSSEGSRCLLERSHSRRSLDGGRRSLDGGRRSLDGGRRSLDGGRRSLDGSQRPLDGSRRSLDGSRRSLDGSGRWSSDGSARKSSDGSCSLDRDAGLQSSSSLRSGGLTRKKSEHGGGLSHNPQNRTKPNDDESFTNHSETFDEFTSLPKFHSPDACREPEAIVHRHQTDPYCHSTSPPDSYCHETRNSDQSLGTTVTTSHHSSSSSYRHLSNSRDREQSSRSLLSVNTEEEVSFYESRKKRGVLNRGGAVNLQHLAGGGANNRDRRFFNGQSLSDLNQSSFHSMDSITFFEEDNGLQTSNVERPDSKILLVSSSEFQLSSASNNPYTVDGRTMPVMQNVIVPSHVRTFSDFSNGPSISNHSNAVSGSYSPGMPFPPHLGAPGFNGSRQSSLASLGSFGEPKEFGRTGHVDVIKMIQIMHDCSDSIPVLTRSMQQISNLRLSPKDCADVAALGGINAIMKAMRRFPREAELQLCACRALCNISSTAENQLALVDAGAATWLLDNVMESFAGISELQQEAIATLANLAAHANNLEVLVKKEIILKVVQTMSNHRNAVGVQMKGCSVITNLASHQSPVKSSVMTAGGGGAVVMAMISHSKNPLMQVKGLQALRNLSAHCEENKLTLAHIGGIDCAITAMQVHRDNPIVQEAGAWTLCNLASNMNSKNQIGNLGGMDTVVGTIWNHSRDAAVLEWCVRCLLSLSLSPSNCNLLLQAGGISAVVHAMQTQEKSSVVQEVGCAVLRNLAFNEVSKMRIVNEQALDAIVLAMMLYKEDVKIQEQACQLLLQLAIPQNVTSMHASNVVERVQTAARRFPSHCGGPAWRLLGLLEQFSLEYNSINRRVPQM